MSDANTRNSGSRRARRATLLALATALALSVLALPAARAADPEKYAPAYGGHCACAVANGDLVKTDPDAWKVVDGRLYLNYSLKIQKEWEKDIPGYIDRADANWPGLAGNDDPQSSGERP